MNEETIKYRDAFPKEYTTASLNPPSRNDVLEEVAQEFDKMKVFGDTAASFAIFVRSMKKEYAQQQRANIPESPM